MAQYETLILLASKLELEHVGLWSQNTRRILCSEIAKEFLDLNLNGTQKAVNQRGAFMPFKNLTI